MNALPQSTRALLFSLLCWMASGGTTLTAATITFDDLTFVRTYGVVSGQNGGAVLSVDGFIESLTVVPNIRIYSATSESLQFSDMPSFEGMFQFYPALTWATGRMGEMRPQFGPAGSGLLISLTLSPDTQFSSVSVCIPADFCNDVSAPSFLARHPGEGLTVEFSMAVKEINYTTVPDATNSATLLMGVLVALAIFRSAFARFR